MGKPCTTEQLQMMDLDIKPYSRDGYTSSFCRINKASQAIQSPRTVPFFLLVSLLDGYSFPNILVKGIVAFKH